MTAMHKRQIQLTNMHIREATSREESIVYNFQIFSPHILHTSFYPTPSFLTTLLPLYLYSSHYTPFSPLPYTSLHFPSIYFTALHFQMIFTSLKFTSLQFQMIFIFNSPHQSLSLPSFSEYLFYKGRFLTLLRVTGSSLELSYSHRNISLYPSFASFSNFTFMIYPAQIVWPL